MEDNYSDYRPWIGIDLDGTLAVAADKFDPHSIGKPVPAIVKMVRDFIAQGKRVKIFTARVCITGQKSDAGTADLAFSLYQHALISVWLSEIFYTALEVTCVKDFLCEQIYDDRAWRVETNTGEIIGQEPRRHPCSVSGYGLPVHESEVS